MKNTTSAVPQVTVRTTTINGQKRFELKKFPVYFGTEASPNTIQLPPKLAKTKHGMLDIRDGRLIYEEVGKFATKINDMDITQSTTVLRPGTTELQIGRVKVTVENDLPAVIKKKPRANKMIKYGLLSFFGIVVLAVGTQILLNILGSKEYELAGFDLSPSPLSKYTETKLSSTTFIPELNDLDPHNTIYTFYFNGKDSISIPHSKINGFSLPQNLITENELEKNLDVTLRITSPETKIKNTKTKTFRIDNRKRKFVSDGITMEVDIDGRRLEYRIDGSDITRIEVDYGDGRTKLSGREGRGGYFEIGNYQFKASIHVRNKINPIVFETKAVIK